MNQLPLFDELDQQLLEAEEMLSKKREAEEAAMREEASKPKTCSHCGEVSPNSAMHMINHGEVFNGWCSKRLMFNSWAKPGTWAEQHEQQFATSSQWLSERGWVACDEHDRANWVEGYVPYWERKK